MIHRLILILTLLIPAKNILADDDCVRALPEATVKDISKVSNYSISGVDSRLLTESFILTSGQRVEVIQSGCAHFGLTYRFPVNSFPKHETITTALNLVGQLTNVAPLMTKYIYGALLSVKDKSSSPESITVTEGYDWVYVSTEFSDGNTVLVVTYDIAL